MTRLVSASYSRLADYEACPQRARFKYADKIPEPVQEDSPLVRGSKIHEDIEHYISGVTVELEHDFGSWNEFIDEMRQINISSHPTPITQEEMWLFDEAWRTTTFDNHERPVYYIAKLDLMQRVEPHAAVLVDWKTGKKDKNVIKHADQAMQYAIAAFMRFADLEDLVTIFAYLDADERTTMAISREEAMRQFAMLQPRLQRFFADRTFMPRPSFFHCGYCPYKTGTLGKSKIQGTGDCKVNP